MPRSHMNSSPPTMANDAEIALLAARTALAQALLESKEECVTTLVPRLSSLGSRAYKAHRQAVSRMSIEVLVRSLATGQPPEPHEVAFLNEFGRLAAKEHIPFAVLIRGCVTFRECALEHVRSLAKTLGTPAPVIDDFRQMITMTVDAGLITVASYHGRLLRRISDARDRLEAELEQKVEERTRELARKNAELLKLDEMKSQFVSTASHELRTPLTAIRAFSELLAEDSLDDAQRREFAQAINLESERLTRLTADLLDLSRMEAGNAAWRPCAVDIRKAMERLVQAQRSVAERKGLSLELDLRDDLPKVSADPEGLGQVLLNLTDNALKFTREGRVVLSARQVHERVVIAVTDTGCGINEADLRHVFNPFYQAGNIMTEKPSGAGLGLAICRQILSQHGSELCVDSTPGQGSRFSFALSIPS